MKAFLMIFFLSFGQMAISGTPIPVKGTLVSYNNETFKVRRGNNLQDFKLSLLTEDQKEELAKYLGKTISFQVEAKRYHQTQKQKASKK